jgi:hypothetical protein
LVLSRLPIFPTPAVCEAKFDGKDYPATGPSVPPGYTRDVTENRRAFLRDDSESTFTASPDGKNFDRD